MALFLFIVIVAIALGIIGAVIKGLVFLLAVGVVVFLIDFVVLGIVLRGKRKRPSR